MPTITLTTDYGLRDPYAGQLKGALLTACPSAQLIDVTHHITPFDLVEAAYFLNNVYAHYPAGTVHVCTVNSQGDADTPWLAFRKGGQTFILPDNGLLFLLFPGGVADAVRLPTVGEDPSSKATISAAVRRLMLGYAPQRIGIAAKDLVQSIRPEPVVSKDFIRGSIVHIDRYDNAVLNVHRSLVDRMAAGRRVYTRFSNSDPIVDIVDHYHEAEQGELLARYTSRGYVELAINMGRAAQLFGLERDQLVQMEFQH